MHESFLYSILLTTLWIFVVFIIIKFHENLSKEHILSQNPEISSPKLQNEGKSDPV